MPNAKDELEAKMGKLKNANTDELTQDDLKTVVGSDETEGGPVCHCVCEGLGYSYRDEGKAD